MKPQDTPDRPTKGERTRRRLFEAAIQRFQTDGYEGASMRAIARDVEVAPGLLYRYFDGKEAIVGELYGELLGQWAERAGDMPDGTWAARVLWLTREAFEVLGEYRTLLRALAPSMIHGDPTTSPMKNESSQRVAGVTFRRAVEGASDTPAARDIDAYAELVYVGHLALILFWVMDQSADQRATDRVLVESERMAPLFKIGLKMPIVGKSILALGKAITNGLREEAA